MPLTLDYILQSPLFEKLCAAILTLAIGLIGYGLVCFFQTKPGMICWRILKIMMKVAAFPFLVAFLAGGSSCRCRNCGRYRPW